MFECSFSSSVPYHLDSVMFLVALRINGKEYTTMFILVTETHNKKSPPKALFESSESRLAN